MTFPLAHTFQSINIRPLVIRLTIGIGIYALYRALVGYLAANVGYFSLLKYPITILYGSSAIFLCTAFWLLNRKKPLLPQIIGTTTKQHWVIGMVSVAVCYGLTYAITIYLGYGRENVMKSLGWGMNTNQYWLLMASIVVLPPIVEELAFRHFLMTALPIEAAKWIGWFAIVLTATWFWHVHSAYNYWPTKALMFAMGLVLGWARFATGGLLLPVALHSMAEVIALVGDAVWVRLAAT